MRLLASLSARRDAAYDHTYHHKLRGRIWNALEDTEYDERHGDGEPNGFVFSNVFPPGEMTEGDERHVMVASPDEALLTHVAQDLQNNRELNVGEMPFSIENVQGLAPDVGEPGSTGTIESGTGVLVRIPPWKHEEYGIDDEYEDASTFWRPEHSLRPFREQIEANLDRKHGLFAPEYLPGPSDRDTELFDEYELIKTFAIPVEVTQGQEITHVLSKWRFSYRVRDDHHRRHLNLALDCGIGERNGLGFGFVNKEAPDD